MIWIARFWEWIDTRAIVRRASLAFTFFMTYAAFEWAKAFASASHADGSAIALIIGAVTAPVTALQVYVFKSYSESRNDQSKD